MGPALGLIGLLGGLVALIWLVVALIRRKPKRILGLALSGFFVLFVLGACAHSTPEPTSTTTPSSTPTPTVTRSIPESLRTLSSTPTPILTASTPSIPVGRNGIDREIQIDGDRGSSSVWDESTPAGRDGTGISDGDPVGDSTMWNVNWDILPGVYSAPGGPECRWLIDQEWGREVGEGYDQVVQIDAMDIVFVASHGCGEWTRGQLLSLSEISDSLRDGVVKVESESGSGSGFIWNAVEVDDSVWAFIITNQHVIENDESPRVLIVDESYEAIVLGADVVKDVALLLVCCSSSFESLSVVNPDSIRGITRVGLNVAALGYPYGEYESTLGATVDIPYLSERDLVPHTAPLNPGNSGGPLIRIFDGRVIGVNTYGSNRAGYAAPIYSIEGLLGQWCQAAGLGLLGKCSGLR